MMSETTENERARIQALHRYKILDTPPDGAFDRITTLACKILKVPVSTTSLVDTKRIWFKSYHGLDVQEVRREPGLCASVILNKVPYVLNDASADPRSVAHPLVAGEFGCRFYAGVPLTTYDNHHIGALCVMDFEPRTITEQELNILSDLAQVVMDEMEFRFALRHIDELNKENSNLLAALSHEIRTPMNGVMGVASLLHSTELNEEQKEYIKIIESSGKSLLSMVDHLLEYSRLKVYKYDALFKNKD